MIGIEEPGTVTVGNPIPNRQDVAAVRVPPPIATVEGFNVDFTSVRRRGRFLWACLFPFGAVDYEQQQNSTDKNF